MKTLTITIMLLLLIGCGGSLGTEVGPYLFGPCPPIDDPFYGDYVDDWNECFDRDDRYNPDLKMVREYCSTCHEIY